jgi:hypothetical protein
MIERLRAADEPVEVIVLGAGHDLADQLGGLGFEYRRIVPSRVEELMRQ